MNIKSDNHHLREFILVMPFDNLASIMWSVAASGVLWGVAALKLPYNASSDSIEEQGKNLGTGLAIAIAATGFYLFITGIAIIFQWPLNVKIANTLYGGYNILFGGAAALGGLVLLSSSVALFLRRGLKAVSYLALVIGLYLTVDAYSIWIYKLTTEPALSTLLYLSPAAALILSVLFTHTDNKWLRRLFAISAFILALAWLLFAANVTLEHLKP